MVVFSGCDAQAVHRRGRARRAGPTDPTDPGFFARATQALFQNVFTGEAGVGSDGAEAGTFEGQVVRPVESELASLEAGAYTCPLFSST
jgi:hypothetical protein